MSYQFIYSIIITCCIITNVTHATNDQKAIESMFQLRDQAYSEKDIEKAISHLSMNFNAGAVTRENLIDGIQEFFKSNKDISLSTHIIELKIQKNNAIVETINKFKGKDIDTGGIWNQIKYRLYFLKKEDGQWKITSLHRPEYIAGQIYDDKKMSRKILSRIKSIFADIDNAYANKDSNKIISYISRNFYANIFTREKLVESVNKFINSHEDIVVKSTIRGIKVYNNNALVETEVVYHAKKLKTGEKLDDKKNRLIFLKKEISDWKILSLKNIESEKGVLSDNIFTDDTFKYRITILRTWSFYKVKSVGAPLILSTLLFISPDLTSSMILGVVELQTSISADKIVQGDEQATKKIARDYTLLSEGWITINGEKAYTSLSHFTLKNEPMKRKRIYFVNDKLVYFIVCDTPQKLFSKYEQDFEKIVNGFYFLSKGDDLSIRDQVAIKLAKGGVSGNIYTNSEFGFQVAKPPDWEMNSASTTFLFQINITAPDKKSFVMFGAVKLPYQLTAKDVIHSEEKATKSVALSYSLLSENEVKIAGQNGYQSITLFNIGGNERKRKRAYFIKDNIAYFFVCDAVPPSMYDEYKDEFESIINSFTWN